MKTSYRIMGLGAVSTLLACLAACSNEPRDDADIVDFVRLGQDIAEAKCSACHAIERGAPSPRPEAPPLPTALLDYDIESLGLEFEAHMISGTDIMPAFELEPDELGALIAYILSAEATGPE